MKKFTITLITDSTTTYHSQLAEIASVPDQDGNISISRQNIRVFWQGGKADDLKKVASVVLLDENRGFAFEGQLSATANPPRDVAEGVEFFLDRIA